MEQIECRPLVVAIPKVNDGLMGYLNKAMTYPFYGYQKQFQSLRIRLLFIRSWVYTQTRSFIVDTILCGWNENHYTNIINTWYRFTYCRRTLFCHLLWLLTFTYLRLIHSYFHCLYAQISVKIISGIILKRKKNKSLYIQLQDIKMIWSSTDVYDRAANVGKLMKTIDFSQH